MLYTSIVNQSLIKLGIKFRHKKEKGSLMQKIYQKLRLSCKNISKTLQLKLSQRRIK